MKRLASTAALVVAFSLVALNTAGGGRFVAIRHRQAQLGEERLRRRVGQWIADHTPRGASVAMEAIGYQGTHARRRIIDLAGLISPDVVRIHDESAGGAAAFHRILAELRPDYLVLRSFEVDRNESWFGGPLFATDAQRAWFGEHYAEVRRFDAELPIWGRAGRVTLFARK